MAVGFFTSINQFKLPAVSCVWLYRNSRAYYFLQEYILLSTQMDIKTDQTFIEEI